MQRLQRELARSQKKVQIMKRQLKKAQISQKLADNQNKQEDKVKENVEISKKRVHKHQSSIDAERQQHLDAIAALDEEAKHLAAKANEAAEKTDAKLEKERDQHVQRIMNKFKEAYERKKNELKERHEQEKEAKAQTADDAETILAQHKDEMNELENRMNVERERQLQLLEEKVRAKKERQRQKILKRQKKMLEDNKRKKEEAEQLLKEKEEMLAASTKDDDNKNVDDDEDDNNKDDTTSSESNEKEKIKRLMKDTMADEENENDEEHRIDMAKHIVENVLKQRFDAETAELLKTQYTERAEFIRDTLVNDNSLSIEQVEEKAKNEIDEKHAKLHDELLTKHRNELIEHFKEICPESDVTDDDFPSVQAKRTISLQEARRERDERLAAERQKVEEEIRKLKEEEEKKKAEEWQKLNNEMKEMESRQTEEIELIAKSKDERKRVIQEQFLAQQMEAKEKELAEQKDLGEEQRAQILRDHKREMAQLGSAMESERARQKANLIKQAQERAARKRRRELKRKQERLRSARRDRNQSAASFRSVSVAASRDDDQQSIIDENMELIPASFKNITWRSPSEADPNIIEEHSIKLEATAEPVFRKLLAIEEAIRELSNKATNIQSLYEDEMDKKIPYLGENIVEPIEISLDQLSTRNLTILQFSNMLIELFATNELGVKPIKDNITIPPNIERTRLKIAEKLPRSNESNHIKCAYHRSSYYNSNDNEIYIHMNKLEHSGQFLVEVVHILAHISSEEWDDRHPNFIREFYKGLEHLCSDFFMSRSKYALQYMNENDTLPENMKEGVIGELDDDDLLINKAPLDQRLRTLKELLRKSDHKEYVDDEFFGPLLLNERLERYEVFQNTRLVKKHLDDIEIDMNNIGNQMEVLSSHDHFIYEPLNNIINQDKNNDEIWRTTSLQNVNDALNEKLIEISKQLSNVAKQIFDEENTSSTNVKIQTKRRLLEQLENEKLKIVEELEKVQKELL